MGYYSDMKAFIWDVKNQEKLVERITDYIKDAEVNDLSDEELLEKYFGMDYRTCEKKRWCEWKNLKHEFTAHLNKIDIDFLKTYAEFKYDGDLTDKWYDDKFLALFLAPYVEGTLSFVGEDGDVWAYKIEGGKVFPQVMVDQLPL